MTRLSLGLAEGGFVPGAVLYLTHWVSRRDRAWVFGLFLIGLPIANLLVPSLSAVLLRLHAFGLRGWQWLFIAEGMSTVILGAIISFCLTDRHQKANWLSSQEWAQLFQPIVNGRLHDRPASVRPLWRIVLHRQRLLLIGNIVFAYPCIYGFNFLLPLILQCLSNLPAASVAALSARPYILAAIGGVVAGISSDRTGERRWHSAIPLSVCASGLALVARWQDQFAIALGLLCFGGSAAASIGLMAVLANLGGFVGPCVMGTLYTRTHSYLVRVDHHLPVAGRVAAAHFKATHSNTKDFARMKSSFFLVPIAAVLAALVLDRPAKAQSPQYDHLYVFGDSFSDNGNFYRLMQGQAPASPPYYNGRFSNGPVWIEYLAEDLGLAGQLTDLAYSGASSGQYNAYVSDPSSPLYATGLLSQVNNFVAANPSVDGNSLYVVWAGLNDYARNPLDPLVVIANIESAVSSLANAGAKSILVVNLPNLGAVPGTRNNPQSASTHTALTAAHNAELSAELSILRQRLPTVSIIELDVSSQFDQMLAHGGNYGFADTTDSCIGNTGYPPMPTSNTSGTCAAEPSQFLFWDSIHPTTAGHRYIASDAFSVLHANAVTPGGGDAISISSVLNAIGSDGTLSPGAPFTIIGSNFAASLLPGAFPMATQLESTSVQVGGLPAPLYIVAPGQIKAQIPWEVQAGSTSVSITNGTQSVAQTINVVPVGPAIFSSDGVHAAAFDQDGSSNATTPAAPGAIVGLYATGLGEVVPSATTGGIASSTTLSPTVAPVTAAVGNKRAAVTFAGLAPGTVGFYQVNIVIPTDVPGGLVPVVIEVGGQPSNQAMIWVQP